MTAFTRSALKFLLRGMAWLLFVVAGFGFWFGGRAISEFVPIDRILVEMEGIGLAVGTEALGYLAKTTADDLEKGGGSSGQ